MWGIRSPLATQIKVGHRKCPRKYGSVCMTRNQWSLRGWKTGPLEGPSPMPSWTPFSMDNPWRAAWIHTYILKKSVDVSLLTTIEECNVSVDITIFYLVGSWADDIARYSEIKLVKLWCMMSIYKPGVKPQVKRMLYLALKNTERRISYRFSFTCSQDEVVASCSYWEAALF